MKKGLFIVFEGLDLTGKSTIIKELKNKYPEFIYTREPGGTNCKLSEDIRKFILEYPEVMDSTTEAYLFAASRSAHVQQIKKWLDEGKTVICDRYLSSSMYYQGIMKGLGIDLVKGINKYAIDGLIPDKTFFITVSENERNRRMLQRNEINQLDKQSINIDYIKANADYFNITHALSKNGAYMIDTTNGELSKYIDEIEKTINNIQK